MSRQKLGQHFLSSPAWRERIARTLPADANTTWLEIGPGHGEMTEFLAQRARRVIAIETDSALASTLRQRAAGLLSTEPTAGPRTLPANLPAKAAASAATAGWPNVEIIESDILAVDLSTLTRNQAPDPLTNPDQSNDPRTDSASLAKPHRPSGGRSFSPDVPPASSSGVSTPEDSSFRQGTAFYSEERRAAVPSAGVTTGPSDPEARLQARERAPFRQGTASAVPKGGVEKGPSGAEVGRSLYASQSQTNAQRFRVYGNLPYYITSPILSHLFRFAAQIESVHIVIQLEVAERIVATPGHREYAYLSALCQYFAHPEIVLRIPPGAFRPPPKVNSALLAMTLPGERARLHIRDDLAFLKFLQNCFSQKRKTLRNNLKNIFTDPQIAAALAACELTPQSRAEEISLTQFAQLYRQLTPSDCHSEE